MAPKAFFVMSAGLALILLGCLGLTQARENVGEIDEDCTKGMTHYEAASPYPYPVVFLTKYGVQQQFLCDTKTDGGGWLLIQRRSAGDVDFHKTWTEYKYGFGELWTDFWIGLEAIHNLTQSGSYEMRVDLEYNGKSYYANYGKFSIANEADHFKLNIGSYSGNAGEALIEYHNNMKFSTKENDNDKHSSKNCASDFYGGWWFNGNGGCVSSSLNGKWGLGPEWYPLTGSGRASSSEMKIRRK